MVGGFFGLFPDHQLAHSIGSRLVELFRDEPDIVITEDGVKAAAKHPHGRVILNLLLPRREITNPLEKLYWLIFPNDTYGKREENITEAQRHGIRALWRIIDAWTKASPGST